MRRKIPNLITISTYGTIYNRLDCLLLSYLYFYPICMLGLVAQPNILPTYHQTVYQHDLYRGLAVHLLHEVTCLYSLVEELLWLDLLGFLC